MVHIRPLLNYKYCSTLSSHDLYWRLFKAIYLPQEKFSINSANDWKVNKLIKHAIEVS